MSHFLVATNVVLKSHIDQPLVARIQQKHYAFSMLGFLYPAKLNHRHFGGFFMLKNRVYVLKEGMWEY